MVLVFVWIASFIMIISSYIQIVANGITSSFLWLSGIPLYTWTTTSSSIHLKCDFFLRKSLQDVIKVKNLEMSLAWIAQ